MCEQAIFPRELLSVKWVNNFTQVQLNWNQDYFCGFSFRFFQSVRCSIRWTNVTEALGTRLVLVRTFWRFVVDYQFFEGALALRLGRNTKSLLGSPSWSGHILAVRLVFS